MSTMSVETKAVERLVSAGTALNDMLEETFVVEGAPNSQQWKDNIANMRKVLGEIAEKATEPTPTTAATESKGVPLAVLFRPARDTLRQAIEELLPSVTQVAEDTYPSVEKNHLEDFRDSLIAVRDAFDVLEATELRSGEPIKLTDVLTPANGAQKTEQRLHRASDGIC